MSSLICQGNFCPLTFSVFEGPKNRERIDRDGRGGDNFLSGNLKSGEIHRMLANEVVRLFLLVPENSMAWINNLFMTIRPKFDSQQVIFTGPQNSTVWCILRAVPCNRQHPMVLSTF